MKKEMVTGIKRKAVCVANRESPEESFRMNGRKGISERRFEKKVREEDSGE